MLLALCPAMAMPAPGGTADGAPAEAATALQHDGTAACSPSATGTPLPGDAAFDAAPAPALPEDRQFTVERVRIHRLPIFDLEDPEQDNWLFRAANRIAATFGLQTREWVIANDLLFAAGDTVSPQALRESERLLRARPYLYDARVRPGVPCSGDGSDRIDVDVVTRDVWTLNPRLDVERSGGTSSFAAGFADVNVFGTGKSLSFGYARDVDRSGIDVAWSDPNVRGSHATVSLALADNDDGHEHALSLARPFHALTTRRAGGISLRDGAFEQAYYRRGDEFARFRHATRGGSVHAGFSNGLESGVQRRLRVGFAWSRDRFAALPDAPPPSPLPRDRTLAWPFVAFESIEDEYATLRNVSRVGRREDVHLGRRVEVTAGWSTPGEDRLVVAASLSDGHRLDGGALLRYRLDAHGLFRRAREAAEDTTLGATIEYQRPHADRLRFLATAAATWVDGLTSTQLLLGGDSGLRGYPLRYQDGDRRLLLSAEERYFSDLYLWHAVRVAAAVFVDAGRAWDPARPRAGGDGWLADAGFGLRFESTRTQSGQVVHVDVAFPLVDGPSVAGTQLLLTVRESL